jgi:hypothetical protein
MGEVSNQQIYDLLLEISDTLEHIDASADEILVEMRILIQELEAGARVAQAMMQSSRAATFAVRSA